MRCFAAAPPRSIHKFGMLQGVTQPVQASIKATATVWPKPKYAPCVSARCRGEVMGMGSLSQAGDRRCRLEFGHAIEASLRWQAQPNSPSQSGTQEWTAEHPARVPLPFTNDTTWCSYRLSIEHYNRYSKTNMAHTTGMSRHNFAQGYGAAGTFVQ